ncbi:Fur family transcriptional regulator [Dictyobacter arantiisoli]|uniref:Transcriptional repressor n=1 Tax=Dictyobacter arantiisoli TaxID=2014874 RepID=A0A5A5TG56_9CHLR|nr:Fur family transcriptional regulator [Dictyobacter arantiisoli]GCF09894.1 transcriptional repressor [Dictyobacter arantiisoli]
MHSFQQSSDAILRKHGYRLTPQRHMILNVIQEAQGHLSIDQIMERVQQQNPCVSLSTVYRTLELLKSVDLIRESHLPDAQPLYEIADGQAHHHLICRRCHVTIHLDETLLGDLHEQLQTQYGFHHLSLELVAAGYCDNCWHTLQQELAQDNIDPQPTLDIVSQD